MNQNTYSKTDLKKGAEHQKLYRNIDVICFIGAEHRDIQNIYKNLREK